jgi:4-amino-4-deoxy-L-arabinose transferase-like glycosyltransferase
MKNFKNTFLLIAIVALALFLRIYLLGAVPSGLTNDEADIGYDAYAILMTGSDQWGHFLPITSFMGFGDYRLPLYTYLVIPFVKVFNLNSFSVRIPSALFGGVSVVLIYLLTKRILLKTTINREAAGLLTALLFALSPWSIGLSRIGIESNVAIAFMLSSLLLLIHAFYKKKLLFISAIFFALTIYTYTSYSLFTPMVIAVSALFFKNEFMKIKKTAILSLVLFAVLLIPLFIFKSTAGVRASQISFVNSQDNIGLLTNLNDRRGSCVEAFPSVLCKITENKQVLFVNTFVRNYLNHFSANFLYLNGTTTQYSILPQRGLFYIIEIIFLLCGVMYVLRYKNKSILFIAVLLLISPIPDALTGDGHYSRASEMIPFLLILEGIGCIYLWSLLRFSQSMVRFFSRSLIVLLVLYSFTSFITSYFSYFPKHYSLYSQFGYEEWAKLVKQKKEQYDLIYLSRYGNDTKQYIYYLFYTKYSPREFQKKKGITYAHSDKGWISVDKISNIFFVDRIPSEKKLTEIQYKKVLLVTHPSELPADFPFKNMEVVRDKKGDEVFVFVTMKSLLEYYHDQAVKQ